MGTLTASWPEVSGATTYHVTYSSDGTNSWQLAAIDHPAAGNTTEGIVSITISSGVDNGKYYIVGVRAKNSHGGSGWVNSDFVHPLYAPDPVQSLIAARSGTSIAVSWSAPANDGGTAVTGYDVNYSTDGGRSWTRIASNQSGASADISNADNTVNYIIAVRAINGMGNGGWTNSNTLPGLGAPASATISRAAGSVTVGWSAVSGATGYNINLSADSGGSWTRAVSNATGTSATISSGIANGSSYIAAVQAVNAHGGSHWTNSANSVAGIYPPGAPTGVTAARSGTSISISWTAPASNGGVALSGYDVNYSTDGARSWTRLASNQSGTTATISNADNTVDYIIAARANNSVGASPWTRSATVAGLDAPEYVTAFRYPAAGFTDAGWPAVEGATGYDVNLIFNATHHYNMANNVTGTTHRIKDGTQYGGIVFVVSVRARNAHGPGPWRNSPTAKETRTLTASNITMNSATLTLETFADTWYYKADQAPHTSCSSGQTGLTADLSDLSAGETYTYTAYRDSGCATAVVTASAFTLPGVSVSNLTNTATNNNAITATVRQAVAFTTGDHPGGYTLHSVTAWMQLTAGTVDLDWAIHEASTDSDPKPASAIANTTFSGSIPTTSNHANHTFTCSGSGCTLDPDTPYFLVASTSSGSYLWHYTADLSETAAPSDNGWEIGKGWLSSYSNNTWGDWSTFNDVSKFRVSATLGPTLAATSPTATTATLTISHHSGAWWYKGNQSGATCTPVAAGTSSASLSSLTAGTSYTYKAYDTSGCASANEIATVTFKQAAGFRDSGKDITLMSGNNNPYGIWANSTTMWVVDINDKKLYAYNLSTRARDAGKDITLDASKILYASVTSDGTTMWVSENLTSNKLFAYSISSKSADSSKDLTLHADNDDHDGIWTDGTTMWVNDDTDQKIYAYTIASGARDSSKDITLHSDNDASNALWSDGTTMWVADNTDDKLYAYTMSDGSRNSAKDYASLYVQSLEPRGIWSDGTTMWVADNDADKLYAYHAIE